MVLIVEPHCSVHLTTSNSLRKQQKKKCDQNNRFNQLDLMSCSVIWKLCIRSHLTVGGCCECSLMHTILIKGVGKQIQRSQQCDSSSFLLKDSNGVWTSLFHKKTVHSSHSSRRTNTEYCIHFFLFPGLQSSLVQCHYTIQREIAVSLASPI